MEYNRIKRQTVHEGYSNRGVRGLFRGVWMIMPLKTGACAKAVAERLGYEFIVVLPDTQVADACALATPTYQPKEIDDANPPEFSAAV